MPWPQVNRDSLLKMAETDQLPKKINLPTGKNIFMWVYTELNGGNFFFGKERCQVVIRVGENFLESCKAKGEESLLYRILFLYDCCSHVS